ncbi:Zn-ribbon domain-containing OB-fold protein [Roseomonas xinghualingensis]|uniref:Zn-ribbon domain-containing OB-fold protein n=1 Tax=Roseomonas xinghualingensis TaxID=2986475 RepID=UPI0021F0F4DB|nr:Zn-ribbon domain-containing OB-fold protein [Roseomonas sp. SXEYE001]MCV4209219.1 Zn-ribbon domain-containing OB-fold protein [Roseomonas sp. SXEYE001]
MAEDPARLLPVPNADTAPFWEGAARGELRLQRCAACGQAQFPPRAICVHCHAPAPAWEAASGRGRLVSHTRVHRPPSPAFKPDLPYVVALVALEEGPRIMVNLRGVAAAEPRIGGALRIRFGPPGGAHIIALPYAEEDPVQR